MTPTIGPKLKMTGRMIGLAAGARSVRAVGVRRGAVEWVLEAELDPGEPLDRALAEFLRASPVARTAGRLRWPAPRVVAALSPAYAQVKRVAGLPAVANRRLLAQVVRHGAERFFLRAGTPLVTGGLQADGEGDPWGAAYATSSVHAVTHACRAAGLALHAVVPALWVAGRGVTDGRVVWPDADTRTDLAFRPDRSLASLHRVQGDDPAPADAPSPVAALAALGDDAWRFADAYGAALLPAGDVVAYRPGSDTAGHRSAPPAWRLRAAGGVAAAAAAWAVAAPGLAARRVARRETAVLAATARTAAAARVAEADLRRTTRALNELAAFARDRRPVAPLLADLTRALPSGSALVAFRVDSAGGSVVALAPRAAALVSALERVPRIVGPEIVGPIAREPAPVAPGAPAPAGRPPELERVTVRFALAATLGTPTAGL